MTDEEKARAVMAEMKRLAIEAFPLMQQLGRIPSAAFRGAGPSADLIADMLDAAAKLRESMEAIMGRAILFDGLERKA